MTIQDVEQKAAENGLDRETILDFFRLLPTADTEITKQMFGAWVTSLRDAGVDIDEEWVDRVDHDLERHHRLTPETIQGAPHAEYKSLNPKHNKEFHFGRV